MLVSRGFSRQFHLVNALYFLFSKIKLFTPHKIHSLGQKIWKFLNLLALIKKRLGLASLDWLVCRFAPFDEISDGVDRRTKFQ